MSLRWGRVRRDGGRTTRVARLNRWLLVGLAPPKKVLRILLENLRRFVHPSQARERPRILAEEFRKLPDQLHGRGIDLIGLDAGNITLVGSDLLCHCRKRQPLFMSQLLHQVAEMGQSCLLIKGANQDEL